MTIRDLKEQLETLLATGTPDDAQVWVDINGNWGHRAQIIAIRTPLEPMEGTRFITLARGISGDLEHGWEKV